MLIGQYFSKITLKNRIAIPKKFRDEVGNNVIIARWYEGCLVVIPKVRWNSILEKLTGQMEILTKAVRDTDRFVLGSAYEVDLDAQGRFVIPANLKEYAKLIEDVIFLGLGDRLELWDSKVWADREQGVQKEAAQELESLTLKLNKKSE